MAREPRKQTSPLRSLWAGILGISAEVLMTAAVIASGFLVCLFWWGITR